MISKGCFQKIGKELTRLHAKQNRSEVSSPSFDPLINLGINLAISHSLFILSSLTLYKMGSCFSFWESMNKYTSEIPISITEPRHDKTNNMAVRPVKTQISLGICPVWSESSLSAWRKLGSLATHWAHSEDSDQTGQMPRLIWVFTGCTLILLVLSCHGSIIHLKIIEGPEILNLLPGFIWGASILNKELELLLESSFTKTLNVSQKNWYGWGILGGTNL